MSSPRHTIQMTHEDCTPRILQPFSYAVSSAISHFPDMNLESDSDLLSAAPMSEPSPTKLEGRVKPGTTVRSCGFFPTNWQTHRVNFCFPHSDRLPFLNFQQSPDSWSHRNIYATTVSGWIKFGRFCTSSTARGGGGGSFKNRKLIGEIGCCSVPLSNWLIN